MLWPTSVFVSQVCPHQMTFLQNAMLRGNEGVEAGGKSSSSSSSSSRRRRTSSGSGTTSSTRQAWPVEETEGFILVTFLGQVLLCCNFIAWPVLSFTRGSFPCAFLPRCSRAPSCGCPHDPFRKLGPWTRFRAQWVQTSKSAKLAYVCGALACPMPQNSISIYVIGAWISWLCQEARQELLSSTSCHGILIVTAQELSKIGGAAATHLTCCCYKKFARVRFLEFELQRLVQLPSKPSHFHACFRWPRMLLVSITWLSVFGLCLVESSGK